MFEFSAASTQPKLTELDAKKLFADLGITEAVLHRAIQVAEDVRRHMLRAAPKQPPMVPGVGFWGIALGILAEVDGWDLIQQNKMTVVYHRDQNIAITVANGDSGAGIAEASPTTRYPKGFAHQSAIGTNQDLSRQTSLLELLVPVGEAESTKADEDEGVPYPTWYLLIHRDRDEARFELSVPKSIKDNLPSEWEPRCFFAPAPLSSFGTTTEPLAVADRPTVTIEPIDI